MITSIINKYIIFNIFFLGMGNDDFQIREECQTKIEYLIDGYPLTYGEFLIGLNSKTTNPEIRSRSNRIISKYRVWYINSYVPKNVPIYPCCDFYTVEWYPQNLRLSKFLHDYYDMADEESRTKGYGYGGEKYENVMGPYWYIYRRATELYIRDLLRNGATYKECDHILELMWESEILKKHDCQKTPNLPKRWNGGYLKDEIP